MRPSDSFVFVFSMLPGGGSFENYSDLDVPGTNEAQPLDAFDCFDPQLHRILVVAWRIVAEGFPFGVYPQDEARVYRTTATAFIAAESTRTALRGEESPDGWRPGARWQGRQAWLLF